MGKLRLLAATMGLAMSLVLALAVCAVPAFAAPGDATVTVRVEGDTAYCNNINVYLDITPVTDFCAATVTVTYDDTVLDFVSCSDGELSGEPLDVSCTEIVSGELNATIWYGLDGISGSGYLMDVVFHVIGDPCASGLIDIDGTLSDSHMNEITADWVGGSVCVSNPRTVTSYNPAGNPNEFNLGDDVFIQGSGFLPDKDYNVWIVPYDECTQVKEGQDLSDLRGPGMVCTIKTGPDGSISSDKPIWQVPPGDDPDDPQPCTYWEIVVDDGDGIFNGAKDGLDACCCDEWGFHIYPELPTAALFGIGLIGLIGVGGFVGLRRRRAVQTASDS